MDRIVLVIVFIVTEFLNIAINDLKHCNQWVGTIPVINILFVRSSLVIGGSKGASPLAPTIFLISCSFLATLKNLYVGNPSYKNRGSATTHVRCNWTLSEIPCKRLIQTRMHSSGMLQRPLAEGGGGWSCTLSLSLPQPLVRTPSTTPSCLHAPCPHPHTHPAQVHTCILGYTPPRQVHAGIHPHGQTNMSKNITFVSRSVITLNPL